MLWSSVSWIRALALALVGCALLAHGASAQSPQGYWQFNTAGTFLDDSSGNSSTLTASGDAAFTAAGKFGGGLALDGTGDFLSRAAFPTGLPTGGSAYTTSAWIKTSVNGNHGIVGWGNYGTGNQVNAFRTGGPNPTDIQNYWWGNDFVVTNSGGINIFDGNYHNVVASYNTATNRQSIYIDGTIIGSRIATGLNAQASNFRIGSTNGSEFFQGSIDDVAIYNTALSNNQIKAIATGTSPQLLPTAGASGRWYANDLRATLADGNPVSSWNDSIAGAAATNTLTARPMFIANALGGNAAVRFDGVNDNLRVLAAVNPMAGADAFSVAVAFRTSTAGTGPAGQWYQNSGLVDAEQAGIQDDWGLVFNGNGQVGAGLGNPDVTTYSSSTSLNDGRLHTAIYTRSGTLLSLYVDGQLAGTSNLGGTGPVNFADMMFGSLLTGAPFFNGDIFEIQTYNFALTGAQANALSNTLELNNVPEPASIAIWTLLGMAATAGAWKLRRGKKQG